MPTAPRMLLERQEEFRAGVKKSRGKVIVLVHPLYEEVRDFETRRLRPPPKLVAYERSLTSLTESGAPTPLSGWNAVHGLFRAVGVKRILIGGMQAREPDAEDIDRRRRKDFRVGETLRREREAVQEHERGLKKTPRRTLIEGCAGGAYSHFIRAGHPQVRWLPNLAFPERPH